MTLQTTAPKYSVGKVADADCDCVVIVSDSVKTVASVDAQLGEQLAKYAQVSDSVEKEVALVRADKHPFRVVYAPTGPLNRDYDDIRRVFDAANKGMQKALASGSKKPHVAINVDDSHFGKTTSLVGLLGAMDPFYVPVLTREKLPERKQKAEKMSASVKTTALDAESLVCLASKLDAARWVFRDIGGTDPERMTAANIAQYVKDLFPEGSPVKLNIVEGQKNFEKDYPCFAAVNRCVADVPKHAGRIIYLDYEGEGEIEQTIYLVGKGVVYDTGGHDLKVQGIMAGMHRDKCGSAAVASVFKFLHDTKPKGIRVCGVMAMVRNAIGTDAYVADEIITARSGARIVIQNTDAEGRMAMCDVLCRMKERALEGLGKDQKPPQLFTIATLTGHALRTYGVGYTAAMDNGPARSRCSAYRIRKYGEALGDMVEVSTIRREDYDFMRCKNEYGDVLQAPSVGATGGARGHQSPGAFLIMASGLDKHGKDSDKPLAYTHLDIAGGAGLWLKNDPPLPAATFGLLGTFVIPRLDCCKAVLQDESKCH